MNEHSALEGRRYERSWRRAVFERVLQLASGAIGERIQRKIDSSRIQKIIVLQVQMVGDSVAFTPTLRAIRSRFPHAQIDLLCSPISAEFYRTCKYVDHLLLDRWFHPRARDLRAEIRLIGRMRATRYDLAICDTSEVSASHGLAALLTGAPMRVGFSANNRGFLYTYQLPTHRDANVIEDNLTIATALGADSFTCDVECYFDDADDQHALQLIPGHDRRPLVAIHAASNWQSKTWLPERWASVADALVLRYGAEVIYVGTAAEREYIDAIRALMRANAVSVAGRTSLPQLGALLSHCDLFIGTDSGPRHIAAGSGRPQITLMSSQDYRHRWDFRRPRETILRTDPPCSPCFQSSCSHRRCMVEISEQMVLDACHHTLVSSNSDQVGQGPFFADSSPEQDSNLEIGTR